MKQVVVLSGKGGTGKTSIAAALFALLPKSFAVDCDVDASNLYLVTSPNILEKSSFIGGRKAKIDYNKCSNCGICFEACNLHSVHKSAEGQVIISESCEGCGACAISCPSGAIYFEPSVDGEVFRSETRFGPLVHARLIPGADNSGKLIATIREKARSLYSDYAIGIFDGPPGIGCPVKSTLTGASAAIVVAEPTVSGVSDVQRLGQLLKYFKIPVALFINKCDINVSLTHKLENIAQHENWRVVGKMPYNINVIKAQKNKRTIVEEDKKSSIFFEQLILFCKELV